MPNVFISGHGGWKPEYGYTRTPRGVSVVFYTHFAKNLMTGMEYQILAGKFTKADRVIGEFSNCPNMQISGQPQEWTTKSEAALNKGHWGEESAVMGAPPGEADYLSALFEMLAEDMSQGDSLTIHWLACSALMLNKQGGSALGVNAEDFQHHNDKPGRYRIVNPDGSFNWV